ncbi:retinol dehydrogenase 11-like isoform X4 [Dreissena polymorpha]|nr:retinol dehydrogenase 11-like isoform X4 [Dreissena polymorpha]XP_052228920.1 retinol dehydrogenase 11-like isoform X4 [Dreissena polymorpha]XP_052228921.1 retinol dehydrogenase 11-like isoform X4 [Dreissena polymorpha]
MDLLWQILLAVLVVMVTCLVVVKVYVESIKGHCTSTRDLTGKVALITGANTGIGFYTALDLAKRNARVILACRDEHKAAATVQKIQEATGNMNVEAHRLDLSLMSSVREFAKSFKGEEQLDILINNAGVAGIPYMKTVEGFDTCFATNHLGHFLLTNLLLDLLKKSQPSRIVTVSSMAHAWTKEFDVENLNGEKQPWSPSPGSISQSYFRSKLANVLFTRELAKRLEGTGVTSTCLHPGPVNTKLLYDAFHPALKPLHFIIVAHFVKTGEEGAQTSIHCAVSEELEGVTGRYYVDCREAESSLLSKDLGLARQLWEYSERVTGLK